MSKGHESMFAGTPSIEETVIRLQDFILKDSERANGAGIAAEVGDYAAVFEVAWEVANKVGGVYTTIRSKAEQATAKLNQDYFLVGPVGESTWGEVEEVDCPNPIIEKAVRSLREQGIEVFCGRWLIEGSPHVILFDLRSTSRYLQGWRRQLEEQIQMKIPAADVGCHEAIAFGFCAKMLIEEFRNGLSARQKVLGHFHEWMSGVALMLLRHQGVAVSTVYTSHSTLVGRYLCSGKRTDFYAELAGLDGEAEASKMGIAHRHALEKASIQRCHVFSAVSQVVADEALQLFRRKADLLLPNGLAVLKFEALHTLQALHAEAKEKIREFVMGHFHGCPDVKSNKSLYFFSGGRYEFRNKGIDLILEALAKLNAQLKADKSETTVVMFLLFPRENGGISQETIRSQAVINQVRESVKVLEAKLERRILDISYSGKMPDPDSLLDNSDEILLKRCVQAANQRESNPALTTHVIDPNTDPILKMAAKLNLTNSAEDRVKLIFLPRFLSKSNPAFPIDYEEFVRGCHLAVFPSYYEPWGYTPAESAILGVPTITSTLSGFGRFLESRLKPAVLDSMGVYIVDRMNLSRAASVDQLSSILYSFSNKTRRDRIMMRNQMEQTVKDELDWKALHSRYLEAWALAVAKSDGEF